MTPYKQLVRHDPDNGAYGDCWRTCIACLLDLHPSQVPHFYADAVAAGFGYMTHELTEETGRMARAWLRERGYELFEITFEAQYVKLRGEAIFGAGAYILTGRSPNYDCCHCVIGRGNAEVVWDPSPTGKGLEGPWYHEGKPYYTLEFIVPATQYKPNHLGVTV